MLEKGKPLRIIIIIIVFLMFKIMQLSSNKRELCCHEKVHTESNVRIIQRFMLGDIFANVNVRK